MQTLDLSPRDPQFVQNPYAAYDAARRRGPVLYWEQYGMAAVFDAASVRALLRDKRLGREVPAARGADAPAHLAAFHAVEAHSMLELEPPCHTRLRGLVLRAFTSRRIAGLGPDITAVADELIAALPRDAPFDLVAAYCTELPVRIIARLLGVPEGMAPDLLRWSHDMVAMYQARRGREIEHRANAAAAEFTAFLRDYIEHRRDRPGDDLISHLIAAREEDGARLSTDEMIGTCILLLNAGHEATVHSLGNAVKCLLEHDTPLDTLAPDRVAATVEELLRYDPPLHMFTRHVYEDVDAGGETLRAGSEVALMLGAACRDPARFADPHIFDPARTPAPHEAFGGGPHFCIGAPLARLEMQIALPRLFDALPGLRLAEAPRYADSYHFHKLDRLMLQA